MLSSCLAFAFLLLAPLVSPTVVCLVPNSRVRALHPSVCSALGEAYAASPTVRRLIHELEDSDVIVHMQRQAAGAAPAGALRFVGATRGARFVRISLDVALPRRQLVALIGHELQHAVEVARAHWVHDQHAFAELYRHLGHAAGPNSTHYDTAEARRVGRRVYWEVSGAALYCC